MGLERTLSIVKPDGVRANLIGEVSRRLEKAGLSIIAERGAKPVSGLLAALEQGTEKPRSCSLPLP